jgi:predicted alpha/beta hydrolase family esterase
MPFDEETVMSEMFRGTGDRTPLVLTVPGFQNSGPGHWQTIWEETRGDCSRVELGLWASPRRNPWVTKLDQAIRTADAPVILAAHSLGCLAVAWWAALAGQPWGAPVIGALLVAPPDVDRADAAQPIGGFGPTPHVSLPFPSILVASRTDPYTSFQRSCDMAKFWGSGLLDLGDAGHVNTESGFGRWTDGERLLDLLADRAGHAANIPSEALTQAAGLARGGFGRLA